MKKYIGVFVVALAALGLWGMLPADAIANPAATYCVEIKGTSSGDGTCRLPNGVVCNEWDLYRGACPGWYGAPGNYASQVVYDENGVQLRDGDVISAAKYGDPDIYIVKFSPHGAYSGYKRLFLNPAIFGFYGHLGGFQKVHPVTTSIRDAFETSGLFRNCETNAERVWATEVTGEDSGTFHHVQVSGDDATRQDPLFFLKVFCINNREEAWYSKSIYPYIALSQIPSYARAKSCTPRPACLDTTPRCEIAEPVEGWCSSPTPTPPAGCKYQQVQCFTTPCDPILVCPTPTATPYVGTGCYVGGCSGQVCSDQQNAVSTCEWQNAYACYHSGSARCERQVSGLCGWTQTADLAACLRTATGQ